MSALEQLPALRELVDRELDGFLPRPDERPAAIHQAMRHSTLGRGKRLRPILAILTADVFGWEAERIAPVASAIELIHTYSLIHDDLPCMDDDDFRRGVPTCHKAFGEAIAVLAGDALLTCAFEMILANGRKQGFSPKILLTVIEELSSAAGSRGMIAGQVEDIESEGQPFDLARLEYIHAHKTGRLFRASVRAGALLAQAPDGELAAVSEYADLFGQVFQITDDILDAEQDAGAPGQPASSDARKEKATYPRLFSLERSRELALEQSERAVGRLAPLMPRAEPLAELVRTLPTRRI